MASIKDLAVLIVDDDIDTRELLEMFLTDQGAKILVAGSAKEARTKLGEHSIDVILTDVGLPDEDGFAFITSLRADSSTRNIPAIAVTGYTDARARKSAIDAGFQKFLTKPLDVLMLPAAIASVVPANDAEDLVETTEVRVLRHIEGRDIGSLLAALNTSTPYRFTSILRLVNEKLESLWTFDRAKAGTDTFPSDFSLASSYCSIVLRERAPFSMTDSLTDARVEAHPARESVRSYCGVPIYREDGSAFGTLCHYDVEPRSIPQGTVGEMERVAKLLMPLVSRASDIPGRK